MSRTDFIPSTFQPYEVPANDVVMWRYMDFAKFVSLLSTKSLYCNSLASFEDPYEGAAGLLDHREAFIAALEDAIRNKVVDGPYSDYIKKYETLVRLQLDEPLDDAAFDDYFVNWFRSDIGGFNEFIRTMTFANCWYESDYESLAMWKLYSNDNINAIAIKSSHGQIRSALAAVNDVNIGRVNYIDYSKPPVNFELMDKLWFKSFHFEHEKEIRINPEYPNYSLFPTDFTNIPSGLLLPIDLNMMIEEVFVSPWSGGWLLDLVTEITQKYGLNVKVTQSEIARKPFY